MSSLRLAIKLSLADAGGGGGVGGDDLEIADGASTTAAAPATTKRVATAKRAAASPTSISSMPPKKTMSVHQPSAPKADAAVGCLVRLAIKQSLGDSGSQHAIVTSASNRITPIRKPKEKTLSIVSECSVASDATPASLKSTGDLGVPSPPSAGGKDSKAIISLSALKSTSSQTGQSTTKTISNGGTGVKLIPKKASAGSMPSSTKNSVASSKIPKPVLYVGLTLERPEQVNSWGLVFNKHKTSHAVIVRVIPPNDGVEGIQVKWNRITTSAPAPSVVYRTASTVMPLGEYEAYIAQNFPPKCEDMRLQESGLLTPHLKPGDAIISVNGIHVSAFPSMGVFASYIRQNCQRKMVLVALRHETVLAAALGQMSVQPSIQGQQQGQGGLVGGKEVTDRIATAVRGAWKRVLVPPKRKASSSPVALKQPKLYRNNMFKDGQGKPILYCDNEDCFFDPEDGKRLKNFVNDEMEKSFHPWLKKRKATWRDSRPRKYMNYIVDEVTEDRECEVLTVQHDFWLANGHDSFEQWLASSKANWARTYSWHKERREALKTECEREVHLPTIATAISDQSLLNQFENWLSARKQQWRLERRKRQRQRVELSDLSMEEYLRDEETPNDPTLSATATTNVYIDAILDQVEGQEHAAKVAESRQPMDISWVFDSGRGAPDDIIVNIMTYLCPSDHGNLLCLSYTSNFLFKQRQDMWRTLCPKHWVLPRRPRKSWAALYITKIRAEEEASRKRSDDLLVKANAIIEKADQLHKLEKLIRKGEKDFEFAVNYTSGVVLERNSLLNLAVIEGRHKITKWLIEEKGADIESFDRGQFTPLMNGAWNGDKQIVRYLLGKGCDRTKVGYNHSSKGLAPPTFEGLTAEGWARKRGHDEVAELIRLGL